MNSRLNIISIIGIIGLVAGCLGLFASYFYGSLYLESQTAPESEVLLKRMVIAFAIGLSALVVAFPTSLVLRRYGKPVLGLILGGGCVLVGALMIARFWYVVTTGSSV